MVDGAHVPGQRPAPRSGLLQAVLWVWLGCVSGACAQRADEGSPEHAVQEFIDRMQGVHGDTQKARVAYELLAAEARAKLEERAVRASAAVGRVVMPEEMLAPSRFYLSFQPRRWSSRKGPGWALVTAQGESPRELREIRCLREQGEWKIVLDIPELPPLGRREAGGVP